MRKLADLEADWWEYAKSNEELAHDLIVILRNSLPDTILDYKSITEQLATRSPQQVAETLTALSVEPNDD